MQRSLRVHFDLFAYDWTWNQSRLLAKACFFLFIRIFHGGTRFRHRYRVACIGAGRQSSASEKCCVKMSIHDIGGALIAEANVLSRQCLSRCLHYCLTHLSK